MRDAMGGSVTIVVIMVFVVFALGYLAFNVNYTKAFRMKNKIISIYEEFNGNCTSECTDKIEAYAKEISYSLEELYCPSGFTKGNNLYCYKEYIYDAEKHFYGSQQSDLGKIKGKNKTGDVKKKKYYTIVTKMNVELPIINKAMSFKFFNLSGDTTLFKIDD